MTVIKEENKIKPQIPKWVMNRRYRRGPFIFFMLGILPLFWGILLVILYIQAPEPRQLTSNAAVLSLEKGSYREKKSVLHLDFDTLKLKAELSSEEEDRYLILVSFSKSFGENEFQFLNSNNKSIQEQRNKLLRFKKLLNVEEIIEVDKVSLSYLPNGYIQELSLNNKVIIKKRNEILFFMLWIVLPLLIGSYIIYLTFKFYNKYQNTFN
ncbi:hypothetical protein [Maribacter polysaccharolyticus]|uniref:hypothetical protein n=1 Tax=Maribacter polysaccharolyticus TaxID=3020831 RepID=UPI00237F2F69|nr:hypothetical protein [Maribacter polysaccharolyticus]MDE3740311.1 hypothetical protein [Maribacter polysaccharolyticus]